MTVPGFDPGLPVKDISWGSKTQIENAILGDPPNWTRYRKAHLWFDPENDESKAGYKLPFARMESGRLVGVRSQLSAAIAALNGARGGVAISPEDRRKAHALASRYLKKFDPDIEVPELKGKTMKMNDDQFLEYVSDQIEKAKTEDVSKRGARMAALSKSVDQVSLESANGATEFEIEIFKAFEGEQTFDLVTSARAADGPAPNTINEEGVKGQGTATNLDELSKRADDLSGPENKPAEQETPGASGDDWPDDMNEAEGESDWGNDPE